MKPVIDNNHCFVCGTENQLGFQLHFNQDPQTGELCADLNIPDHYQGWQDVVHGGILSTLLDEVMVKAAMQVEGAWVTGEITVRFLKPVRTRAHYLLIGKVNRGVGKYVHGEARIEDGRHEVMARATAKIVRL